MEDLLDLFQFVGADALPHKFGALEGQLFVLFEDFVVFADCLFHHLLAHLLLEVVFLSLGFLSGCLGLDEFFLQNLNFLFLPYDFQCYFLFLLILPFVLPNLCVELVNLILDILEFSLQILFPRRDVLFQPLLAVSVAELFAFGNFVFEVGVDEVVVVGSEFHIMLQNLVVF